MLKKAKYIFISQECYIILLPFLCKSIAFIYYKKSYLREIISILEFF